MMSREFSFVLAFALGSSKGVIKGEKKGCKFHVCEKTNQKNVQSEEEDGAVKRKTDDSRSTNAMGIV